MKPSKDIPKLDITAMTSSPLAGGAKGLASPLANLPAITSPITNFQDITRQLTGFTDITRSFRALEWNDRFTKSLEGFVSQMEVRFQRSLPSNWTGFDLDELLAAIVLARTKGISVVWVPRRSIVVELFARKGRWGWRKVLIGNRDAILGDVEACIKRRPTYDPTTKKMTLAAVVALRDGHLEPAQALVGAAITYVVEQFPGSFAQARKLAEEHDPEIVPMTRVRFAVLFTALHRALIRAEDAPRGFNRNTTGGHGAVRTQYTVENCLVGLLLLAGLQRELAVLAKEAHGIRRARQPDVRS
jgi:hypothetical protein